MNSQRLKMMTMANKNPLTYSIVGWAKGLKYAKQKADDNWLTSKR